RLVRTRNRTMLKRRILPTVLAVALAAAVAGASAQARPPAQPAAIGLSPLQLHVEARENPLGIDSVNPMLSWIVGSSQRGQAQTAYQIVVSSDEAKLAADEGDLWDSGKVQGDETTGVAYAGAPLK